MRIWVNFKYSLSGWTVHCLAEDAKTVISPRIRAAKESTLLGLLRIAGADEDTLQKVTRDVLTGRGTVAIAVNDEGKKLLRISAGRWRKRHSNRLG